MIDYEIGRCSRVCVKSQRELKPGETYYSALRRDGGTVIRQDWSSPAWEGPPSDCIGWWKSEVPDPANKKVRWAPNDVIFEFFVDTEERSEQADLRYVLSLLMLRRRLLRWETTSHDEAGQEYMHCYCPKTDTEYEIAVVQIDAERQRLIQDHVAQLLIDAGG